jgi:hypothetical protein
VACRAARGEGAESVKGTHSSPLRRLAALPLSLYQASYKIAGPFLRCRTHGTRTCSITEKERAFGVWVASSWRDKHVTFIATIVHSAPCPGIPVQHAHANRLFTMEKTSMNNGAPCHVLLMLYHMYNNDNQK